MTQAEDMVGLAEELSPAMWHVILNCSIVEDWDRSGCSFGRQWPDIIGGRRGVAFATVNALLVRGILRRKNDLYGLTPLGYQLWMHRRSLARAQNTGGGGA